MRHWKDLTDLEKAKRAGIASIVCAILAIGMVILSIILAVFSV